MLIATAILFCGGFTLWALGQYFAAPRPGMLALTIVFAIFSVALAYYLRHLKRFIGR